MKVKSAIYSAILASSVYGIFSVAGKVTATTENNSCAPEPGPAPYDVTAEQIEAFRRDGVVVIRSLLQGKELEDAIKAGEELNHKKSIAKKIMYKLMTSPYRDLEFQTWRRYPALEKVAFESAAPTIAAKLMGLDGAQLQNDGDGEEKEVRPMRLLKDAMLGYNAGDEGCGWHVDDKLFWPTEDKKVGDRDAGVNVWITLSPVTVQGGGGLVVAPGTHKASFAEKAREAIKGGLNTCHMRESAPDLHDEMEGLKTSYDLQPGDAIFLDRYVFHRGEAFSDLNQGKKEGTKRRITLRYVPADATFQKMQESNITGDDQAIENSGIVTGDPVSVGGKYFPQVWPNSLPEERNATALPDSDPFSFGNIMKIVLNEMRK